MERFARVILGYHGCLKETADALLNGSLPISKWKISENAYDWLGKGIYFWEHSPERAMQWAKNAVRRANKTRTIKAKPAVIGAVLQLGKCFDLTDIGYTSLLAEVHKGVTEAYQTSKRVLPQNKGITPDLKQRNLDCLVLNLALAEAKEASKSFHTVRGAFEEGNEAFPGSKIRMESHIQIAVRNRACVLGVFLPNLT